MRIAMIIPSLAQTGPGIVARDLCEQFLSMGHHCEMFYFDDKFGLEIPCRAIKISTGKEINPQEWDIIHSHGFRPDRFIYKKFKNGNACGCKLITTLHQPICFNELSKTYNVFKSIIGSLLWYKSLKIHNRIVVLNNDTYDRLSIRFKDKTSVIFNGRNIVIKEIDNIDKETIQKLKKRYKVIGTSSSLTKRKGLEQIIKALPQLPEYAFIAVGDGQEKRNLIDLARELKVDNRCLFLGFKSNSVDYLPYFDLFIMCTRSEGFPLALIEAASQGLPTVLSDIPILKAIVSTEMVDFYHLDDINSLVSAVKSADNNHKGEIIYQYYKNRLTANNMAMNYYQLYLSTLS